MFSGWCGASKKAQMGCFLVCMKGNNNENEDPLVNELAKKMDNPSSLLRMTKKILSVSKLSQ